MTADEHARGPGEVKPANKRGTARLAAVQAIYQMEIGGAQLGDVIEEFETYRLGKEIDGVTFRDADAHFFRDIVAGVVKEQRRIDPAVHLALVEDWPLKRIDVTLRAILRAGAYELIGRKDVPARVITRSISTSPKRSLRKMSLESSTAFSTGWRATSAATNSQADAVASAIDVDRRTPNC